MHIVQIYPASIPIKLYGGMERVIESLCEGLVELGHKVTLLSLRGEGKIPGVNHIYLEEHLTYSQKKIFSNYRHLIPTDADILHFHIPSLEYDDKSIVKWPYLVTLHGLIESKIDQQKQLPKNTVGLCQHHALMHGLKSYVFNGLNYSKIPMPSPTALSALSDRKYFSFLGRASLKRKGLHLAKKIARTFHTPLHVGGGRGLSLFGVKYLGHVTNDEKFLMLRNSRAFLFPILWEEPFGLVMIEAMFCGTPVFALSRGAVPEVLQASREGADLFLQAKDENELIEKMRSYKYSSISSLEIRSYAEKHFGHLSMAEKYLALYKKSILERD